MNPPNTSTGISEWRWEFPVQWSFSFLIKDDALWCAAVLLEHLTALEKKPPRIVSEQVPSAS